MNSPPIPKHKHPVSQPQLRISMLTRISISEEYHVQTSQKRRVYKEYFFMVNDCQCTVYSSLFIYFFEAQGEFVHMRIIWQCWMTSSFSLRCFGEKGDGKMESVCKMIHMRASITQIQILVFHTVNFSE